ncbi:hypothetical protein BDN71DRAFT_1162299 [Pleurotus eryngii]|uniref:Uncharacterized protein n=1 Tax=Pleurotus eryngii TaxID=5323 RepID=A0A9P5ZWF1_PLEER|nr:hypothetical protein BDN71DRAFT_1162299 [Pleurotus eryngii]
MSFALYATLAVLACTTWYFGTRRPQSENTPRDLPLPPGPKKLLFVGNLLDAIPSFNGSSTTSGQETQRAPNISSLELDPLLEFLDS